MSALNLDADFRASVDGDLSTCALASLDVVATVSLDGGATVSLGGNVTASLGSGMTTSLAFGLRAEVDRTRAAGALLDTVVRRFLDAIATEGRLAESELELPDGTRGLVLNLANELDDIKALTAFFAEPAGGARSAF